MEKIETTMNEKKKNAYLFENKIPKAKNLFDG
jgi:hypothetical protein